MLSRFQRNPNGFVTGSNGNIRLLFPPLIIIENKNTKKEKILSDSLGLSRVGVTDAIKAP